MASELAAQQCVPCRGGVPPLVGEEIHLLLGQLGGGWSVVEEHHLHKEYAFPDFAEALTFTNKVGAIAENQGHHPDIHLSWGKVTLDTWTHKIDGLTVSDFILAAKADEAL
jgi:4a-hydroxytetrahydrobiopterin dehydratase